MRDNSTILHRLHLWYLDQPEGEAQYYKDNENHWQVIRVKSLWNQVSRVALFLREKKIGPGDRVVLYALNSPEWIQWELGTWLAGAVSVGIHPNTNQSDLESMLKSSRPKLVLTESDLFKDKIPLDADVPAGVYTFASAAQEMIQIVTSDSALLDLQAETFLKSVDTHQPQILVFTSGTTGVPKGVLLGLRQMSVVADALSRDWNLPFAEGCLFSFLPLSHIAEKVQAVGVAFSQRYPVWFNSRYERVMEELKEVRPTMLLAVPRVWERIKEGVENGKPKLLRRLMEFEKIGSIADKIYLSQIKEQLGLDRLQLAVSGAAKLPPSVGEWFAGIGIEIQEIYGMSESCGLITLTKKGRKNFSCVGYPSLGLEVKLSSEGEIWVKGEHVFFGYDHDPEETAKVLLEDGWLKTGDLGEWIPSANGNPELQIIGRSREIIKLSNGKMIAPVPLENALKEISEVSNVCVVGEGRSQLMALLTLQDKVLMEYKFVPGAIEGLAVEDEKLKALIATKIQDLYEQQKLNHKIHKFVILSREFSIQQHELTATQKLNRNQIQKNFQYFIDLQYEI